MTPELPTIHNPAYNDTTTTVTQVPAKVDTTATPTTTTTIKPFNLAAGAVVSAAVSPLTQPLAARNVVEGNVQQQLTTLLHELLAKTATTTTTALNEVTTKTIPLTTGNATLCNSSNNLTTFTATGTRLLTAAIGPKQTMPLTTNITATATGTAIATTTTTVTATATTRLTTFTSILPTATTNAFIQMNSSNFGNCADAANSISSSNSTGSGSDAVSHGAVSSDLINATAHASSNAVADIPTVDSYLTAMAWPKALIVAIFLFLILVTVVGNTLVILSVLTTRRLRTVTNCFVMNLAITDWLVGTCVMPPAVVLYIVGSWRFGWILCDIWISLDVLLCTGSILSLCAISLDRYLAVTQPLTYSKKRRSKRLALFMIFVVWVMALSITCPPYLGWYEPGRRQQGYVDCRYNQNKGYVVFSAMGSFFIPLAVMLYVYLKIGYVLTSRRQRIVRDANSERTADHDIDCDNFISESEHFQCATPKFPSFKRRWGQLSNGNAAACNGKTYSLHCSKCNKSFLNESTTTIGGLKHQASFYELVEISRLTSLIQCSAIGCKYAGTCLHHSSTTVGLTLGERRASTLPIQTLHYTESGTSFSETCLAVSGTTTTTTSSNTATGIKFNQSCVHQNPQSTPPQHTHHHHQHHHSHHSHRIPMRVSTTKRDTKTAKTLTMVMGGFIACWLPFFVYYLLIPFLPRAAVLEGLMIFLTWVGWVNCAINPFIYAFYNPDFRTAFWRLTCRRFCKQKPPPNHMAMFRG